MLIAGTLQTTQSGKSLPELLINLFAINLIE